jgi:hypothetical protein
VASFGFFAAGALRARTAFLKAWRGFFVGSDGFESLRRMGGNGVAGEVKTLELWR